MHEQQPPAPATPVTEGTSDSALRTSEARLRLALDVGELGTWTWDLRTGDGDIDERGARIVGLPDGDVRDVRHAQTDRIHPEDLQDVLDALQAGVTAGGTFELAYRVIHPDGSVHHVVSRARVLTDDLGVPIQLVGTNRDVTVERTTAERERTGREAAEAFLAVMSHELRTPVTTIYGTASLLRKNPTSPDLPELLADIEEEAERLQRIIDDLLVLSRVERGLVALDPEPLLVPRVLDELLVGLRRRYPAVTFRVHGAASAPMVMADATAVRQVLQNLIGNAAKYAGGDGPVEIAMDARPDALAVSVLDRGPGLGDDPERLFGLFVRSPQTAKRASGTGIGLYVARALANGMGGQLEGMGRESGGACMRLTLPRPTDAFDG